MQNIILLVLCLLIGIALRRFNRVPDNAHVSLNGFIIHVAFPSLILSQLHHLNLERSLIFSVLMPWVVFLTGAAFFWLIATYFRLPPATAGALMLTGGLANTSFVGLPMIDAFIGRSGIPTGILIDTLGTYLALSTVGITVACLCSRGAASAREVAGRVMTFPPLIAVVIALATMDLTRPEWLDGVLARLGGTLAPLALVSVGLQLRFDAWQGNRGHLALGLSFKLIAAPVMAGLLYFGAAGVHDDAVRVTFLESAMGPQIGAAIVAIQYGLNPPLVTLMVGVGTVLAFVTASCWWQALIFVS